MRTNIDIDDALMAEARRVTGLPTKKATIEEALRLLLRLRGQQDILALAGKVSWTGDLDASREGRGVKLSPSTRRSGSIISMIDRHNRS